VGEFLAGVGEHGDASFGVGREFHDELLAITGQGGRFDDATADDGDGKIGDVELGGWRGSMSDFEQSPAEPEACEACDCGGALEIAGESDGGEDGTRRYRKGDGPLISTP
jgi:hypothetical protein